MIKVRATLYKAEYKKIKDVLSYFFGIYKLKIKDRIYGNEFKYIDSEVEFHCYSSLEKKWNENKENFLIDAELKKDEKGAQNFIIKLSSLLEEHGVIYDIEYQEEDENGCLIGDEVSQRHPNYTNFMKENYGE